MMDKISNSLAVMDSPQAGQLRKEKGKQAEGEFGGELQAANQLQAQAVPAASRQASGVRIAGGDRAAVLGSQDSDGKTADPATSQAKSLLEKKLEQLKTGEAKNAKEAKAVSRIATAAERSPLTLKSATSMNAATSITGLNPWSRDWVFQEGDDENPDLKGLFGNSPKQTPSALPGAGQNSKAMPQTRSDAGAGAMSAESAQELAAAGIDPKQLDGMLRQLNGSIEMVNQAQMSQTTGQTMQGGSAQADRSRSQNALGGKLSGAEFLSTLGTVQPNGAQAHGKQQGFGGFDGRNPQGGESAQGELAGRIGRADKAELQLIQGGAKPKKFGESPTAERAMSMETPMVAAGTRLESAQPAPTVQVTGHVTSGNMAQDRLSTESLMGMSTGIRGLSNQGGGEMHVRLKPDNLGELHLKVVTQGNSVGLQIQASDEKARKIIEESMSHLKDSLSSQSLNLAQVDVSVAQPTSSGHSAEMNYQESRQQNAGYGDFGGMNQNTNHSQGDSGSQQRNELPAARSVGLNSNAIRGTAVGSTGSSRAQSASDGRLDVMA